MKSQTIQMALWRESTPLEIDVRPKFGVMPFGNSEMDVPEGHMKIAQRLNAGMPATPGQVPKGRLKKEAAGTFSRPFGTRIGLTAFPACGVEMWRGELGELPFPHPARQTGRAVFPHPASGQGTQGFAHGRFAVSFSSRSRPSFS